MENKNCEKTINVLNEYIDGELTPEECSAVQAHIESCPACKKEYEELCMIKKLFNDVQEEAPPELLSNIMTAVRTQKNDTKKHKKLTEKIAVVAVAATIVLTISVSPLMFALINGGASSSDNSSVENEALNKSEDLAPEDCDGATSDKEMILIDGLNFGISYIVYLSSGDTLQIIFEKDVAHFKNKKFNYELSNNQITLTDDCEKLLLNLILSENDELLGFREAAHSDD